MKKGDKVRFLSDVGGGVIADILKSGMVLVEDADGFQLPVPASEVVVIETDRLNFVHPPKEAQPKKPAPQTKAETRAAYERTLPKPKPATATDKAANEKETDPADSPITFHPRPEERRGGEVLSVWLDFVPVNAKEISTTPFDCYLVNDCNYYVAFTYQSADNAVWKLRAQGVLEPNTKLCIEHVERSMLGELERVAVQLIAFKTDKPFAMKPPVNATLRIDITKFFKAHTFRESLFFEEPVLEYAIVEDDRPAQHILVTASDVQKALHEKETGGRTAKQPNRPPRMPKPDPKTPLEVDLHAHEVLETTAGMSNGDILEYQMGVFRQTMKEHLREKGKRIVFIHGKGDGVLRKAITTELKRYYKTCTFQDASFQQYGFGATLVIIH